MQAAGRDLSPAQQQVRAPAASRASRGYPTNPCISFQSASDRKSGTRTWIGSKHLTAQPIDTDGQASPLACEAVLRRKECTAEQLLLLSA